jgi:hypothetical protein
MGNRMFRIRNRAERFRAKKLKLLRWGAERPIAAEQLSSKYLFVMEWDKGTLVPDGFFKRREWMLRPYWPLPIWKKLPVFTITAKGREELARLEQIENDLKQRGVVFMREMS